MLQSIKIFNFLDLAHGMDGVEIIIKKCTTPMVLDAGMALVVQQLLNLIAV